MSATASAIPYEKQFDMQASRTCGAACLSMVYHSLGQEVPQRVIWPLIAKKNLYGSIASTTHLMAAEAITRSFAAVAIQARHPLQALRVCRDSGIRAILNHRLKPDSPAGHYTVFVDIDDTHVVLHDPYFGPSRRLTHEVLLDLWQPRLPNSEIVGNFLIGIASEPSPATPCATCRSVLVSPVQCPRCKNPVSLQPGALLACMNTACAARLWNYLCCPTCDLTWNFTVESPRPSSASAAPAPDAAARASAPPPAAIPAMNASLSSGPPTSAPDPLNLAKLFEELDKFRSHVLSIPAAANHPEIQKQFDFIKTTREQLTLAHAESIANRKIHQEQLAAFAEGAKQRQEAHQKKLDELNKPLAALDGDALARALLKNLGFIN
jgi:hypothetical protein